MLLVLLVLLVLVPFYFRGSSSRCVKLWWVNHGNSEQTGLPCFSVRVQRVPGLYLRLLPKRQARLLLLVGLLFLSCLKIEQDEV